MVVSEVTTCHQPPGASVTVASRFIRIVDTTAMRFGLEKCDTVRLVALGLLAVKTLLYLAAPPASLAR